MTLREKRLFNASLHAEPSSDDILSLRMRHTGRTAAPDLLGRDLRNDHPGLEADDILNDVVRQFQDGWIVARARHRHLDYT